MALWTTYPDTLDVSGLNTILDIIQGKPIDKNAAGLQLFNVLGFAYGKWIAGPTAGMNAISDEQLIDECKAYAANPKGMHAINWANLIALVIKVLTIIGPFINPQPA